MSNQSRIILGEAIKCVPEFGFSNAAYLHALQKLNIQPRTVSHLWPRGFPAALAEYAVKLSTIASQQVLEAKYSKSTIIELIAKNQDAFIENRLTLPCGANVVEDALITKINTLSPLVAKWHEAVHQEFFPTNIPYSIINLAEFADIVAYYIERVESVNKLLKPAKDILVFKKQAQDSTLQPKEDISNFLMSFLSGVPLSSGPHIGGLWGQLSWCSRRMEIGVLYCSTAASLMGDKTVNFGETRAMVKEASKKFF